MIQKISKTSFFPIILLVVQPNLGHAQNEAPPYAPIIEEISPQTKTAPPLDEETLAQLEKRYSELKAREAAALARFEPADNALLAKLEDALQTGISPDLLEWEEKSLEWFAARIVQADPQARLPMPGRNARLAVAMMRMKLDYSVPRRDGQSVIRLKKDAPVLQVARAGSPINAILWMPEIGYLKLPPEYVTPYIDRSDLEQIMQIGEAEE